MFFKPSIEREIKKRGITLLLHSTHLYKNLPHILADGKIHTARELITRYGRERAARLLHDPRRYEQFAVGLDYINASLTIPNVELLYHRSKSEWQSEWVHFALDLSLLNLSDSRFSPVSAAAGRGKFIAPGIEGFRALFVKSVEDYTRQSLSNNEPTHPQAEVLIKGPLDLASVLTIYVPDREVLLEVSRLCDQNRRTISIAVAPHHFVWPARLMPSVS